jgi:ADP-heptose:LPS heptosyltransferase
LPGVSWYSFQLGANEEPPLPGLVSLDSSIRNFSDTAYALSGMQLVITVDTALAHLAGALGIPTLMLVAFIPDFRWMMGRDDSPWYPTLRIYRQPSPGDWDTVIRQVVEDLSGDQVG